jgi:AraC-like DNA-binding protein
LALVAKHVNVSRFHFCKWFKKATGMTLTEYVIRVRLEKAKTLLADPTVRISEVVFAAGFGSIPRFNSVFKRRVGMSPTEYRATLHSSVPM